MRRPGQRRNDDWITWESRVRPRNVFTGKGIENFYYYFSRNALLLELNEGNRPSPLINVEEFWKFSGERGRGGLGPLSSEQICGWYSIPPPPAWPTACKVIENIGIIYREAWKVRAINTYVGGRSSETCGIAGLIRRISAMPTDSVEIWDTSPAERSGNPRPGKRILQRYIS